MIIWLLLVRAMTSSKRERKLSSDGCFGLSVMGLIEMFTFDAGIYFLLLEVTSNA